MRIDPHSYADDLQPAVEQLDWRARVDFDRRQLFAQAELRFRAPGAGPLDLDTRELSIEAVEDLDGHPLKFTVSPAEPTLGARLHVELPNGAAGVRIRYQTSPNASALQWLTPEQTAGGKLPFLFSQCQAIHARSVIPVQDTPRIRIRYKAELDVPAAMRGLMAAGFVSREEKDGRALERYEMPQPIPPYLFAFAVGDLVSRDLGPRSRVWSEPATIEASAYEFAEVDSMLLAAEKLFGPYDWDRYDFLVLPPSFPYGGMENPRLTFLTPTLLAGDRSLVAVLAHELAHSWAGNLITNANAEHFWLNEGLTVYAERRIIEALYGKETAAIHAAIGWQSLEEAVASFSERPQLTRLRTQLAGVDPDDAYSTVPYEKGFLLFRAMEEAMGRAKFDAFLQSYLKRFRFKSITTEEFAAFAQSEAPGVLEKVNAKSYFDGEGIPATAVRPRSARLEALQKLGQAAPPDEAKGWTPIEWQVYLGGLKAPLSGEQLASLEERFHLTESGNYEVLMAWLELAVKSGHAKAIARTEQVLGQVGRMKYLKPLYKALLSREELKAKARELFNRYRPGYHPIAAQVIEAVLAKAGV